MNKTHPACLIRQIVTKAVWAPALVIIFRWLAMELHIRKQLDHAIHFSGGLAICYFIYRCLDIFSFYLGDLRRWVRYLLTFTASCTVALFWEFSELVSDFILGTHIQYNVMETLFDLIYGTLGASVTLSLIMIVKFFHRS